ncbi:reverse transcriptase-like protein [Elysia marginata]|uniref:Reverse transcriptase-like protein n=1 Tax=Elysia marginata TaxID=1093978 RepID=A0AAV4IKN7_9GAST|nr:reverse transcriptase-like protein [Elysia marginata]
MALIDFSCAFDRVWHTGLLHKLIQLGAPPCLVRSIKAFLANRQSRVRFEGKTSRHLKFTGGVPQGGVLSPTWFLIFINDISTNLPEGIEISLVADDLALLVQHENLDEAASLLQQGLQCVEDWSLQWKMTLNVEKCEVTHFSKWTKEATWRPTVKLLGQNLSYAEFPTFLGVTFDRQLTFRQHVGRIKQKAAKRINTLRCLAGKSWGSEKEDLRLVYLAYIKSAWYPCVSKENREKLEVTQRDAARTITGCTKNTNSKLLINEAGLLPLYVESDIAQATAYERCLRLPGDDPLREIAENPVRRRLKSLGTWRENGKSSAKDSGLEDLPRERLIPVPDIPPWMIPDTFSCSPSLTTSVSETEPSGSTESSS